MKKGNWKVLFVSFLSVIAVSLFGSLFMGDVKSGWYASIKPSISPPDYLFGIVWPILYILIALALYFSWTNSKGRLRRLVGWIYGINLVLNAIWTPLFFGLKNPLYGFIDIVLIWITIVWMLFVSWKADKKAFWMIVPYFLWVSFATVLNGMVLFS